MEYLVVYDIATDTREGERRLRRVAKKCEGYGQRVQKSVFECVLNAGQLDELVNDLAEIVVPGVDTIRLYRLLEPIRDHLRVIGRAADYDLRGPLIL